MHVRQFLDGPVRLAQDPATVPLAVYIRPFRDGSIRRADDPRAVRLAVLQKSGARSHTLVRPPDLGQRPRALREALGIHAAPRHGRVRLKMAIPDVAGGLAGQFHPARGACARARTRAPGGLGGAGPATRSSSHGQ